MISPQQKMAEAERLKQAGKFTDAERQYREILAKMPDFHPALHALGLMANQAGNLLMAIELISRAIKIDASVAMYYSNLGEIYRRSGKFEQAIAACKKAISLNPDNQDAHYNLGVALSDNSEPKKAAECYRYILRLNPDHSLAWNNLGAALEKMGDQTAALEAYEKAVDIDPTNAEAQNNLGAIYSQLGRLDEARQHFEAAIESQPEFISPHYNLSSLKTYVPNDPHLTTLESLSFKPPKQEHDSHIRYYFALGKAREDIGQYDRAFDAYAEGNRLKRVQLQYDENRACEMIDSIIQLFNSNFFKLRKKSILKCDKIPVFIVGMPRSGTTLIEQILSSHADVFGADELPDLGQVINYAPGSDTQQLFPGHVPGLSAEDFQALAESYIERVWQRSPDSICITDKMPTNFFYIGMIYLMFPNAKIIHSMRDPMDTCLSCYTRLFNMTMDFAYSLEDLGRYFNRYMKLMQHWRDVLPENTFLDVHYEDMVIDNEKQTRRMLEYIGLSWDDACLEFYKNKRPVKTASIAQVRQPIYHSSIGHWERFGAKLNPLKEIVGNYRKNSGDK